MASLLALEELMETVQPELLFVESGGDKVPRKVTHGLGLDEIAAQILTAWKASRARHAKGGLGPRAALH